VLANNIGITGFKSGADAQDPEHVSLDAWRAVMVTNLDGAMFTCQAAIGASCTPRAAHWTSEAVM